MAEKWTAASHPGFVSFALNGGPYFPAHLSALGFLLLVSRAGAILAPLSVTVPAPCWYDPFSSWVKGGAACSSWGWSGQGGHAAHADCARAAAAWRASFTFPSKTLLKFILKFKQRRFPSWPTEVLYVPCQIQHYQKRHSAVHKGVAIRTCPAEAGMETSRAWAWAFLLN